jgi:hypothetical protein
MKVLRNAARVAAVIAALSLSGCILIYSSAISSKSGNGAAVSAQASDMGYLMLVAPQNLTQTANSQLMAQCSSGKVTDVQTELNVRNFFGIVQLYTLNVAGLCQ